MQKLIEKISGGVIDLAKASPNPLDVFKYNVVFFRLQMLLLIIESKKKKDKKEFGYYLGLIKKRLKNEFKLELKKIGDLWSKSQK